MTLQQYWLKTLSSGRYFNNGRMLLNEQYRYECGIYINGACLLHFDICSSSTVFPVMVMACVSVTKWKTSSYFLCSRPLWSSQWLFSITLICSLVLMFYWHKSWQQHCDILPNSVLENKISKVINKSNNVLTDVLIGIRCGENIHANDTQNITHSFTTIVWWLINATLSVLLHIWNMTLYLF
jgi:hypothetical protein